MDYRKIVDKTKKSKYLKQLVFLNKILPFFYICAYLVVIIKLFKAKDKRLFKVILVPLFVYLFITGFRKKINRKRPYDELDFEPVVDAPKGKPGFPSRHTGSAFILSMAVAFISPIGKVLMIPATLIAFLRIKFGLHYVSDVLAGAGIAILSGIIGFFII